MEPNVQTLLGIIFLSVGEAAINVICQTFLYGIYLCLVSILVYVMFTNGLQSRARKWLLASIISMFALLTVFWTFSIADTFQLIGNENSSVRACFGSNNGSGCLVHELTSAHIPAESWLQIFSGILFVNYLIADGIIVWRAWVLCPDQSRVALMIPVGMLAINTVVFLMTVALKAAQSMFPEGPRTRLILLHNMIVGTQLTLLALSLLINISATSIIGLKAWKYRKLLMESGVGVRTPSQAFRILAILVESGVMYILIGVVVLASIVVPVALQKGTVLSEVITTVAMQLVGIYQVVVVLLVEKNRSLDSTFYSFGSRVRLPRTETMSFAPGPVLASGGQISTDIHVTFESTLELTEAGMGGGNIKVSSEEHAAS